jgi:hypothetical protein
MMYKKSIGKKGQETSPLKIIIGAIVILIVAGILLFFFRDTISGERRVIDESLCGVNSDFDHDGVPDIIDDCLCEVEKDCDNKASRDACRAEKDKKCNEDD